MASSSPSKRIRRNSSPKTSPSRSRSEHLEKAIDQLKSIIDPAARAVCTPLESHMAEEYKPIVKELGQYKSKVDRLEKLLEDFDPKAYKRLTEDNKCMAKDIDSLIKKSEKQDAKYERLNDKYERLRDEMDIVEETAIKASTHEASRRIQLIAAGYSPTVQLSTAQREVAYRAGKDALFDAYQGRRVLSPAIGALVTDKATVDRLIDEPDRADRNASAHDSFATAADSLIWRLRNRQDPRRQEYQMRKRIIEAATSMTLQQLI